VNFLDLLDTPLTLLVLLSSIGHLELCVGAKLEHPKSMKILEHMLHKTGQKIELA